MEIPPRTPIHEWAEDDRPREKLQLKGRQALSDAELLAILINSGTTKLSAVQVGQAVLQKAGNDLAALAKLSVKDLCKLPGIGEARAITIVAALELGRRRKDAVRPEKVTITSSADSYAVLRPYLLDVAYEEFFVLLLNRANHVIRVEKISQGGVAGTVADPKLIFRAALEHLASSIILAHNHPSGNRKPSQADIALTRKLRAAGEQLDLPVLDHLIFTEDGYFSFADEGLL